MPAWIAGIHQVCKDASGDVHVNLDSSSPCWNDELRALLEVTEVLPAVFSKEEPWHVLNKVEGSTKLINRNIRILEFFVTFVRFVVKFCSDFWLRLCRARSNSRSCGF